MSESSAEVTRLVSSAAGGDARAESVLLERLYAELHRLARVQMGGGVPVHTLQPTALVNEAWLRMIGPDGGIGQTREWGGRQQFLAFAARAMRSVLVDHARQRQTDKRGGNRQRVPLDVLLDARTDTGVDVVALGDVLDKLMRDDPDLARVVELRFFGGLTMEETASSLGVSLSTAERNWRLARMWLRTELAGPEDGPEDEPENRTGG